MVANCQTCGATYKINNVEQVPQPGSKGEGGVKLPKSTYASEPSSSDESPPLYDYQSETSRLQSELSRIKHENEELNTLAERLQEQLEQAENELELYTNPHLDQKQPIIDELRAQLENLQIGEKGRSSINSEQLSALQNELELLKRSNQDMGRHHLRLTQELDTLRASNQELTSENESLRTQISELGYEKEYLVDNNNTLQNKVDTLRGLLTECETEKGNLLSKQGVESPLSESGNLPEEVQPPDLTARLSQHMPSRGEEQPTNLEERLNQLSDIENVRELLHQKTTEVEKLKRILKNCKEPEASEGLIEEYPVSFAELETKFYGLSGEYLNKKLNEALQEKELLTTEIEQLNEDQKARDAELQSKEAALHTQEQLIKETQGVVNRLKGDNESLVQKNRNLSQNSKKTKEELEEANLLNGESQKRWMLQKNAWDQEKAKLIAENATLKKELTTVKSTRGVTQRLLPQTPLQKSSPIARTGGSPGNTPSGIPFERVAPRSVSRGPPPVTNEFKRDFQAAISQMTTIDDLKAYLSGFDTFTNIHPQLALRLFAACKSILSDLELTEDEKNKLKENTGTQVIKTIIKKALTNLNEGNNIEDLKTRILKTLQEDTTETMFNSTFPFKKYFNRVLEHSSEDEDSDNDNLYEENLKPTDEVLMSTDLLTPPPANPPQNFVGSDSSPAELFSEEDELNANELGRQLSGIMELIFKKDVSEQNSNFRFDTNGRRNKVVNNDKKRIFDALIHTTNTLMDNIITIDDLSNSKLLNLEDQAVFGAFRELRVDYLKSQTVTFKSMAKEINAVLKIVSVALQQNNSSRNLKDIIYHFLTNNELKRYVDEEIKL